MASINRGTRIDIIDDILISRNLKICDSSRDIVHDEISKIRDVTSVYELPYVLNSMLSPKTLNLSQFASLIPFDEIERLDEDIVDVGGLIAALSEDNVFKIEGLYPITFVHQTTMNRFVVKGDGLKYISRYLPPTSSGTMPERSPINDEYTYISGNMDVPMLLMWVAILKQFSEMEDAAIEMELSTVNSTDFKIMKRLGQGNNVVFGAMYLTSNEVGTDSSNEVDESRGLLALKKIRLEIFTIDEIVCELGILHKLKGRCEHIIDYVGWEKSARMSIIVFETGGVDLDKYVTSTLALPPTEKGGSRYPGKLPTDEIKECMRQVLTGLKFIHSYSIIHADIKPANITRTSEGVYKLIDFGESIDMDMTNRLSRKRTEIVTLPYRAPELLMGDPYYDYAIDMWSMGAIFAQLHNNRNFERVVGENEHDDEFVLFQIYRILGTPTEDTWEGVSKLEGWKKTYPKWPLDVNALYDQITLDNELGVDLLMSLFAYPQNRITVIDALEHPYFL